MTKDDDKTDEYGLTAAEEAEYEKMENMASMASCRETTPSQPAA